VGLNVRGRPVSVSRGWCEAWWGSVLKQHSHFAGLTGRHHFKDHSLRWLRAFWMMWAAFNGKT